MILLFLAFTALFFGCVLVWLLIELSGNPPTWTSAEWRQQEEPKAKPFAAGGLLEKKLGDSHGDLDEDRSSAK